MKFSVPAAGRPTSRRLRRDALPDALDGHIMEICRDLAVQARHIRQLQEQAHELRALIREWAQPVRRGSGKLPTRGG